MCPGHFANLLVSKLRLFRSPSQMTHSSFFQKRSPSIGKRWDQNNKEHGELMHRFYCDLCLHEFGTWQVCVERENRLNSEADFSKAAMIFWIFREYLIKVAVENRCSPHFDFRCWCSGAVISVNLVWLHSLFEPMPICKTGRYWCWSND